MFRSYDNPSDVADGNSDRAHWILSQFYQNQLENYEELDPMVASLRSTSLESDQSQDRLKITKQLPFWLHNF